MAISSETAPNSRVTGIRWPALPGPNHVAAFAVLYQLAQSQWWTPEEIRAHQLRQAAALVAHAMANTAFYRERLANVTVSQEHGIEPDIWNRIPILSRAELQEAGAALTAACPVGHGVRHTISTSGSTGRPVSVVSTMLASQFRKAVRLRENIWYRRDYAAKVAAIQRLDAQNRRALNRGARLAWAAGYRTGPLVPRDIAGTVEDHLAWLAAEDPGYLITYPTLVRALAERAIETGQGPAHLKQVDTMGESFDPGVRDLCRRAWGAPVVDKYRAREIGVLAIQCPESEQYHVQAEAALVEVVDDHGSPVPSGAVGRVVVTPLHNYATPLIRYEVGDYAVAGDACPCGRGLPVIRRVIGRTRDLAILPNGQRVFPSLDGKALGQVAPLRQFQLVQLSPEEIEVRLVVSRALNTSETAKLHGALEKAFGHPFRWRVTYVDEISRSASGTFEDFRCDIAP